ncbi:MAG: Uncharacterized protein G01um101418_470 [Parcubacteria group bacterium Gr01-1014_18]|nr:MAG: Uncharacterized protein Greene041636_516 [Parcubacteria group bacterium Greene0416_36]TSC81057.1 MAG: Uncharacterized protein G01um101418_470 [Parcubacteria group bacterium Gr01-1014_18]TSC98791.1 MAG: Uncharacterized protein Greene101420_541 [Parcubacteria group bacterium Greene1014_20]TSD06729.1 MAG: Uncharacterized protein Greene07142_650 [Parcubacteria group bacterium Greene0714_2]
MGKKQSIVILIVSIAIGVLYFLSPQFIHEPLREEARTVGIQEILKNPRKEEEEKVISPFSDSLADLIPKEPVKIVDSVKAPSAETSPAKKMILHSVPFAVQAPFGLWSEPVFQSGCEEASIMMAMAWASGKGKITPEESQRDIWNMSEFEKKNYGFYLDSSTQDTVMWAKAYFDYQEIYWMGGVSIQDIIDELYKGNLVATALNGQILDNPYYNPPGPLEHMLVIIGYDPERDEFITNDPGTKRGANFRYQSDVLFRAIQDYPSGHEEPITKIEKNIIVVKK